MFYKYNILTQNLTSTTQDVSVGRVVTPQACLGTLHESPSIHYEYKTLQPPASSRKASSSAALEVGHGRYPIPNTPGFKKLMELQSRFSTHDGKLVWQKLPMDRPLYLLTFGLAILGTGLSIIGLYKLASPPKNQ